jgi:uncharacterized membrane protein
VLLGVVSFVFYTLGAANHRDLSPLRYTALTAALGWVTIAAATGIVLAAGYAPAPSVADVGDIGPQVLYLAIPGAVVAVLMWNAAVVHAERKAA